MFVTQDTLIKAAAILTEIMKLEGILGFKRLEHEKIGIQNLIGYKLSKVTHNLQNLKSRRKYGMLTKNKFCFQEEN